MEINPDRIRLASLRQDHEVMRKTLGVSGVRRVNADLIDTLVVFLIALVLRDTPVSPWYSMGYFLIRDLPPLRRGVGKTFTGIRIYAADSLRPASAWQLLARGSFNVIIVIPFGFFVMWFFFRVLMVAASCGLIFFLWGRDSIFLKTIGYDFETGQTPADRLAGTHLILPRDVESLARMERKIDELRQGIKAAESSVPLGGS
jgi:hypothetical protein